VDRVSTTIWSGGAAAGLYLGTGLILPVGTPSRVSGVLASNHVERKESQCKFLQFYKENDLLI
jgi:hypothetical protein